MNPKTSVPRSTFRLVVVVVVVYSDIGTFYIALAMQSRLGDETLHERHVYNCNHAARLIDVSRCCTELSKTPDAAKFDKGDETTDAIVFSMGICNNGSEGAPAS